MDYSIQAATPKKFTILHACLLQLCKMKYIECIFSPSFEIQVFITAASCPFKWIKRESCFEYICVHEWCKLKWLASPIFWFYIYIIYYGIIKFYLWKCRRWHLQMYERIISFIYKINTRFLPVPVSAGKRVERLKRIHEGIGYGISQRELLYF